MYGNNYAQSAQNTGTFLTVLVVLIVVAVLICFGNLSKGEAKNQGRSETGWFILGLFFNLNAFIALKVSKAADEEGHDLTLWSVLGIFFGFSSIIAFEAGLNAENKQHDFDCWCILAFFLGLPALLISCFLKPFERVQKVTNSVNNVATQTSVKPTPTAMWDCSKCGTSNASSSLYCSKCGSLKNMK